MSYFSVDNVSKSYGFTEILKDVSFGLEKGQALAIAGGNGCGKSTLLSIIAGAARCNSGTISLNGKTLAKKQLGILIGYVPQGNPFMDEMTVRDNLRFWYAAEKEKLERDSKEGFIKELGLTPYLNYKTSSLSGGTKKKLAIVCALVNCPEVLVLDEPGASLDLVCKKDILNYLDLYRSRGGIIVMSSHEERELKFCNSILMIKQKNLVPVEFEDIENEIRREES